MLKSLVYNSFSHFCNSVNKGDTYLTRKWKTQKRCSIAVAAAIELFDL